MEGQGRMKANIGEGLYAMGDEKRMRFSPAIWLCKAVKLLSDLYDFSLLFAGGKAVSAHLWRLSGRSEGWNRIQAPFPQG